MSRTLIDQTIALAGIFQAVRLVQQTARGERRDAAATQTSLRSIFNTDPASVVDVYGGTSGLAVGLETLASQLSSTQAQRDLELTGYVVSLMHLERKLVRQPDMLRQLASGIKNIDEARGPDDDLDSTVSARLADLYSDTLSTLQPRIMVKGEESVLRNTDSRNMIRALLLAGMRATVLWRQCGGTRLRLVFKRRALLECSREMLSRD